MFCRRLPWTVTVEEKLAATEGVTGPYQNIRQLSGLRVFYRLMSTLRKEVPSFGGKRPRVSD